MPVILHAHPDRNSCIEALAQDIQQRLAVVLQGAGRARMLLPGGSSPEALLPLLARSALDWSRVDISPTDERWVAADAPQSNLRLLRTGLPAARVLDPRQASEPERAAERWGEQVCNWLPFSVVLLGMGEDGHFASLFPGMSGLPAALDPDAVPAALVAEAPVEPRSRLSLNLALLTRCDWLGLLAFGETKRALIEASIADQPATRMLPLHALVHGRTALDIHWAP